MKFKLYLLLVLAFSFFEKGVSQSVKESFSSLADMQNRKIKSISLSVVDENLSLPFKDVLQKPYHWGFLFSYESSKNRGQVFSFLNGIQIGYYHHKYFHHNTFLLWKPRFQFSVFNKVRFQIFPGIGYSHTIPTQETYVLKDGVYKKEKNWGKPHAMASLGIGFNYVLNRQKERPKELFVNYETAVLAPYAPKGTLPFYPNTMLSFGIKFQLTPKFQNNEK